MDANVRVCVCVATSNGPRDMRRGLESRMSTMRMVRSGIRRRVPSSLRISSISILGRCRLTLVDCGVDVCWNDFLLIKKGASWGNWLDCVVGVSITADGFIAILVMVGN